MDINTILQLISSVGFPIVAFLLIFKYNQETVKELRDVISNNTIALNKILAKLDIDEDVNGKE